MEKQVEHSVNLSIGDYLTTNEALSLLGISRSTLNKLRSDGVLIEYKLRHRKLYFKRNDLFKLFTNKQTANNG